MIEYISAENIDDRVLSRAANILSDGGLVALPTDTSWTVACALRSKEGIKRLRLLSGERDERHFTLICSSISQIGAYGSLDNTRFRILKRLTPGPYVFVLRSLLGTEKALDIRRKEVGVRIPDHPVAPALVDVLGGPLYSVTAKRSMAAKGGWEQEGRFEPGIPEDREDLLPSIPEDELFEGGWELGDIPDLDLILDTGEERQRIYSTVLEMLSDEVVLLRSGAGPWPA